MFIKEIQINKVLGCKAVHLTFDESEKFAYVIQSLKQSPFSTAVQLIFSPKYATLKSLLPLEDIPGNGYVLIKFLIKRKIRLEQQQLEAEYDDDTPCTSKQARERELKRISSERKYKFLEITAKRIFRNADQVQYSIDNGPKCWSSLPEFHEKFQTNVEYVLTKAEHVESILNGNWMECIKTELTENWKRNQTTADPFADFVKLYRKMDFDRKHILPKLTKSCLTVKAATSVIEKAQVLKIFRDTSTIFEHVTCQEYRVGFLIPILDKFTDIKDITAERFDFDNLTTCIQLQSRADSLNIWKNVNHAVQCLLLVSLQVAMAFHCQQKLVYLQKLETVYHHQAMQFVTAAYLHKHGQVDAKWTSKNYIQRIINVCAQLAVTAIIDYPGGLPVALENVHLVKCHEADDSGLWNMKIVESSQTCSEDQLLDCVENNLKR